MDSARLLQKWPQAAVFGVLLAISFGAAAAAKPRVDLTHTTPPAKPKSPSITADKVYVRITQYSGAPTVTARAREQIFWDKLPLPKKVLVLANYAADHARSCDTASQPCVGPSGTAEPLRVKQILGDTNTDYQHGFDELLDSLKSPLGKATHDTSLADILKPGLNPIDFDVDARDRWSITFEVYTDPAGLPLRIIHLDDKTGPVGHTDITVAAP